MLRRDHIAFNNTIKVVYQLDGRAVSSYRTSSGQHHRESSSSAYPSIRDQSPSGQPMVAQHQPMNAQQHQPMGGAAQLEQPMRVQYQVDPEQHTVYATRREPDLRLQPSKDSGIAIYFIVTSTFYSNLHSMPLC